MTRFRDVLRRFPRLTLALVVTVLCAMPMRAALADDSLDDLKLIESLGKEKDKPKKAVEPAAKKTVVEDGIEIELNTDNPVGNQIVQLLTGYKKNTHNPTVRGAIVSRLVKIGGEGQKRLLELVQKDYDDAYESYRALYQQRASAAVTAKMRATTQEELDALRKQVRDLSDDPDLTTDKIKKQGDPAMAKLDALLTIDRDAIVKQPEVAGKRHELLDVAAWLNRVKTGERSIDTTALDRDLAQFEDAVAMTSLSVDERDRQVMIENFKVSKQLQPSEAEGILRLNLIRLKVGLRAQAIDPKLVAAGGDHSKDMATLGFFSHTSPVSGKSSPWDRAKLAGTTASGENIFFGITSAEAAITGWWYSPGHHKNMMAPGNVRVGLGRYERHWTQMFGR